MVQFNMEAQQKIFSLSSQKRQKIDASDVFFFKTCGDSNIWDGNRGV